MAYEIHMVVTPESLPEGFPPVDAKDLGYYRLRHQDGQMLLDLMVGYGAVVEIPPTPETVLSSPAHTGAFLRQDGTVVTPAHCAHIARTLRPIIEGGIPPEVLADLAAGWNKRADELQKDAEARGEVAISGFEHFAYDEPTLRNFVIHWGFFNAIAAEHGGYAIT